MLPGSRFQFTGPGAEPGYLHFKNLCQEGVWSPSLCLQAVRRKGKLVLREREREREGRGNQGPLGDGLQPAGRARVTLTQIN